MAIGDIYQVNLHYSGYTVEMVNTFFYVQNDVFTLGSFANNSALLSAKFQDTVLPKIRDATSVDYGFTKVEVFSLFDDDDVWADAFYVTGNRGVSGEGTLMPPFVGYGFQLTTGGNTVRDGAKRFSGVREADTSNQFVASGMYSVLDALATALKADLYASTFTVGWRPCVVKRVKELVDGKNVYRLPRTVGEAIYRVVADVVWKVLLTTQNSRKIGVGA